MQEIAIDKTGFDRPYDPISSQGVMRFAVGTESAFDDMLNGEQAFDKMLFTSPSELTISGGVLAAPTLAVHTVAAQSGTTDEVDTIGASNNSFVLLKAKSGHAIALRHNTGNINNQGLDVTITGHRMALLFCQGGEWSIIGINRPYNISQGDDPSSARDSTQSFSPGSLWFNTTLDRVWECVDASIGAAIWKIVHPWKNGYSTRAQNNGFGPLGFTPSASLGGGSFNAVIDADGTWNRFDTAGGLNDTFYIRGEGSHNEFRPAYSPELQFLVKMDSTITNVRIWIGAFSSQPTNADALAATIKAIGFRYTNGTDTGWTPVLNDGTTQNAGATIGTVSADGVYKLKIRVDAANTTAYFSVNDGAETALTTNFPAIATDMGHYVQLIATTGAVRRILFGRLEVNW